MKSPVIEDARFAKWVEDSARDLGVAMVARGMQTTEYIVRKIISTGQIPEGVYVYSKQMGYVDLASKGEP